MLLSFHCPEKIPCCKQKILHEEILRFGSLYIFAFLILFLSYLANFALLELTQIDLLIGLEMRIIEMMTRLVTHMVHLRFGRCMWGKLRREIRVSWQVKEKMHESILFMWRRFVMEEALLDILFVGRKPYILSELREMLT
jgi:hypothetical protein